MDALTIRTIKRSLPLISLVAGTILLLTTFTSLAEHGYAKRKHVKKYPEYPQINYGTGQKAQQLKRGEYLTKLGDCIACHTAPNNGTPFAGGFPIKTPFGTLYSPNITPDKQHGIGEWTEQQFIKAMREGISPAGKYYYPAFPYLFFNRITTKDLIAIKAYLDAIPAIAQPNKDNTMSFPFNWRFTQLGWRILFFTFEKEGPYVDNPHQSSSWNRGAYLVQGLGHCSMCHTPSYYIFTAKYPLAAPGKKYYLAGNSVEGYFAPNITGKLLKKATDKELKDVFKKDKLIGGGQVQGPMLDANHDSLMYLTDKDIHAIATYLRSVKSETPPKKHHGTGLAAGKAIYNQYCTGCHASGAGGAPKAGDATAWAPKIKHGVEALYKNAITGIGAMPAKGTCLTCTDQEIKDAVDYIVSISKPGVGKASSATAPPPPLTMAQGEKLYNTYCAVCHNPGSTYLNAPKLGDKASWKPIIKQGVDIVIFNTIRGIGNMPERGGCAKCNDADIKAAVKYMVQHSSDKGDYKLW